MEPADNADKAADGAYGWRLGIFASGTAVQGGATLNLFSGAAAVEGITLDGGTVRVDGSPDEAFNAAIGGVAGKLE